MLPEIMATTVFDSLWLSLSFCSINAGRIFPAPPPAYGRSTITTSPRRTVMHDPYDFDSSQEADPVHRLRPSSDRSTDTFHADQRRIARTFLGGGRKCRHA